MYPMKAFLVGCSTTTVSELRRELSRLSVNIGGEYASLKDSLTQCDPSLTEKQLFIVEPKSLDDVRKLERLNETFVGQPILAIVDPNQDSSLLLRSMRAGAAQLVRLPLDPDDFGSAMNRIAMQFGQAINQCRLIAVTGANAGVGATSVAINLAGEITSQGKHSCVLTECSFQFGKLACHLDIEPGLTWFNLLRDPERLDADLVKQSLYKINDHLAVLTGAYNAIQPLDPEARDVMTVLNHLRRTSDVIVLDMPYAFDSTFFEILGNVHDVILIGEQSVPSIHDMKVLVETLNREEHECYARKIGVINRYDSSERDLSLRKVQDILGISHIIPIANDGSAFHKAENAGQFLRDADARSPALEGIQQLAERLLNPAADPSHDPSKPMAQMLNRLATALHLKSE